MGAPDVGGRAEKARASPAARERSDVVARSCCRSGSNDVRHATERPPEVRRTFGHLHPMARAVETDNSACGHPRVTAPVEGWPMGSARSYLELNARGPAGGHKRATRSRIFRMRTNVRPLPNKGNTAQGPVADRLLRVGERPTTPRASARVAGDVREEQNRVEQAYAGGSPNGASHRRGGGRPCMQGMLLKWSETRRQEPPRSRRSVPFWGRMPSDSARARARPRETTRSWGRPACVVR
jgi:hypothetical protein